MLVVLVVLVAQMVQRSQAPVNSSASGFGAEATHDLFVPTSQLLANTPCDTIFYPAYTTNPSFPLIKAGGFNVAVTQLPPTDDVPVHCRYTLGVGKSVEFTVYSYRQDSVIDDTRQALFLRVNSPSIKGGGIDADVIGIIDYYFGDDLIYVGGCRTNMFHPLNDFEFATVTYTGFKCADIVNLNREFTTIFGNYLVQSLDYIYSHYGNSSTADLLYKWGFADRIVDLNFYTEQ